MRYSIQNNVVDTNGNVYSKVVKPGLTTYNKVKHDNKKYIAYLEEHIFPRTFSVPAFDGTTMTVEFAKESDRIQKDGDDSPRKALGELKSANTSLKKIAILNIRDLIKNSEPIAPKSENTHQWLDEGGWSDRIAYMREGDNIYPVIIHIANARGGRHLLYDVSVLTDEGSTVDIGATALASLSDDGTSSSHDNETKSAVKSIEPSSEMLSHQDPDVNNKKSLIFSLSEDTALAKLEANGYYQPVGGSVDRMYEIAAEVAEALTNKFGPLYSLSQEGQQQRPYSDYRLTGEEYCWWRDLQAARRPGSWSS